MPAVTLTPYVEGDVAEVRIYATWKNQEFIQKHYYRMLTTAPPGSDLTATGVLLNIQTNWQASIAPIVPAAFVVRQYWAATIHSVVKITTPGKPFRWLVSYTDQAILLGDVDDKGTDATTEWLPTTDAVTMNRFGFVRSKNWRSSVRQGPLAEADQNSSLLEDTAVLEYNTAFMAAFGGDLVIGGVSAVTPVPSLFSPALAVGKTHDQMSDATQQINEWRASKLVGRQSTRKIRAAGY